MLIHRQGPERLAPPAGVAHFSFTTCMRHVLVVDADESDLLALQASVKMTADDELLRGDEAYRLLLEVVCGLRSPLIGETEVYGQFKNAVANFNLPGSPWGGLLARVFKSLFEDAKQIRQAHLKDLGSQSYGSILRRELKGLTRVHILGAGHLVREILPWMAKDGISITVHCRNPQKSKEELGEALSARVTILPLDDRRGLADAEAIVMAAPVTASWFQVWVPADANPGFVADLRADSSTDAIDGFRNVLDLSQMLSKLNENQALLIERKRTALDAVQEAVASRARHVDYRPFGWDDVCA